MSQTSSEMAVDSHVLGVIETDVFCGKCGFNLHTQKVWRDERLGIPICRCPECGAIDAAGRNTATSSLWLKRLALLGLLFWLAFVLAFIVGTSMLIFGAQMAGPEGLLLEQMETRATGEAVRRTTNSNPPVFISHRLDDPNATFKASEVVLRPRFPSWITGKSEFEPDYQYSYSRETRFAEFVIVTLFLSIPHVICAILIGCLIWFWQRRWQWIWVLLPGVVALFSITYYKANLIDRSTSQVGRDGFELYVGVIVSVVVLQTLTIAAGILFGRPIGRFFISVLIPPKSRQLFAFLWHCDGKTMPVSKSSSDKAFA